METYRLSSKLTEEGNEYLIQTANDVARGAVLTNIYVNGSLSDTTHCPHPYEVKPEEVVSLVNATHAEKKKELERLLEAYHRVQQEADPEAMYQLGVAFQYKGFHSEARNLLRGVLALDSDNHQAANFLGLAELALGHVRLAIEASASAVRMRPGYADYHQNLGEAYLADNACREAIEEFEKAIEINLYYSDAYISIGMAHILSEVLNPDAEGWVSRLAVIKDRLIKASLIYADYRCPEFDKGLAALESKNLTGALDVLKSVVERKRERNRQESVSFYLKAALFPELVSDRTLSERIEYLETEIRKNPNYVDLQAELSLCYLEQSRLIWQKGVEQYRRTHRLSPSLHKVRLAMEQAECTYEDIAIALRRITE